MCMWMLADLYFSHTLYRYPNEMEDTTNILSTLIGLHCIMFIYSIVTSWYGADDNYTKYDWSHTVILCIISTQKIKLMTHQMLLNCVYCDSDIICNGYRAINNRYNVCLDKRKHQTSGFLDWQSWSWTEANAFPIYNMLFVLSRI